MNVKKSRNRFALFLLLVPVIFILLSFTYRLLAGTKSSHFEQDGADIIDREVSEETAPSGKILRRVAIKKRLLGGNVGVAKDEDAETDVGPYDNAYGSPVFPTR